MWKQQKVPMVGIVGGLSTVIRYCSYKIHKKIANWLVRGVSGATTKTETIGVNKIIK